jgi:hypothetical protein
MIFQVFPCHDSADHDNTAIIEIFLSAARAIDTKVA